MYVILSRFLGGSVCMMHGSVNHSFNSNFLQVLCLDGSFIAGIKSWVLGEMPYFSSALEALKARIGLVDQGRVLPARLGLSTCRVRSG